MVICNDMEGGLFPVSVPAGLDAVEKTIEPVANNPNP